jgi:hypothetical protein
LRYRILASVLALGMLGAACSGSSSKGSGDAKGGVVNDASSKLEAAVRAYTAAFLGGDGAGAYGLLSERCRNETARNEFLGAVSLAAAQYGEAKITGYKDDVNGGAATATYELTDSSLNQMDERWVLEDGTWHNDDCDATSQPAAEATTSSTTPKALPKTAGEVLAALKVKGLPVAEVKVFTEADDVNSLLGRPGQYVSKANFHDARLEAKEDFDTTGGGSVETFASVADAQRRTDYLTKITQSLGSMFVEYDYLVDTVLLRLGSELTPTQAEKYHRALTDLVG